MKYIDHRHCGRASFNPNILASVELLPFIYLFRNSSIIETDPMNIIVPVGPLQSGCAAKDASTHDLMTLRLLALSIRSRCRVPLMYLSTFTSFPQSSLSGLLTQVHRIEMSILISFLALDMTNSICVTVWCSAISCSLFSSVCLSSRLT